MKKAFKIFALLLAFLFFAFLGYSVDKTDNDFLGNHLPSSKNETVTYNYNRHLYFTPEEKYVKYIGRTVFYDDCLWFSMSGSGAEFITSADSVQITLVCDNAESLYSNHRPRVAILVNGEIYFDKTLEESENELDLDLSRHIGDKVVTIIKLSESMYSSCGISKISVYSDSDIRPTDEKSIKIEFIGDSITAGYGLDEDNAWAEFSTKTENFTKTYAYLTAKNLNADYSTIAFSGYGVVSGYSSPYKQASEAIVSKYYEDAITNKTFDSPYPLEKWDFSKFTPDVVVINLGVNDAVYCSTQSRKDEFTKAYKELIGLVRWYNKDAHILCVLGEINNSLFPNIEQAVKEYIEETQDTKVYSATVDFEMGANGSVIDGHPNSLSNITASENLTNIISKILNGSFVSSYEEQITEEESLVDIYETTTSDTYTYY